MSEKVKVIGTIIVIEQVQNISATFKKLEFVIEIMDNNYKEVIKFELQGDKCDIINGFQVGQQVEVSYNLKGRCWTNPQGKEVYFNTLAAWRISNVGSQQAPSAAYQQPEPVQHQAPMRSLPQGGIDEDVPFMRKHDMEGG